MKILNKLPLIIGLFLLWVYFQTNNNKVLYQVYQIKEGSIYDGDTLRVISSDNEELKIRFACIDAPEKKMEYGIESRDYLRSLLAKNGNKVNLDIITTDRYGRNVAVLYLLNGSAVQTLQVKNGWVYPYEQYSKDCPIWNEIKKAEAIAINNRVNIYSKDLQKPWEWRRNNK
jgi:endonuclease YncB( thermonuclease family)